MNIAREAGGSEPPSLLLVVLPFPAPTVKAAVKRFGDIDTGIPTQCVVASKAKNAKDQYHKNVVLK